MKIRCAVMDDYQGVALTMADWSPVAEHVDVHSIREHIEREDELVDALRDAGVVVIMRERTPFTASLFSRLPHLKLLVTSGMRNASIDLLAAQKHGVTVCGTASGSEPPAELTWALIFGLARHLPEETSAFRRNGPWQSTVGVTLHGRRLGLLGLGKIGTRVARVGAALGMDVVAWSTHLTQERAEAGGASWVSKEELLETSDVVSLHLVLSERTRGLLSAPELRRMKKTAYLINTSRAPLIDRDALIEALQYGWIAGVGLDVFDLEPVPADDVLRTLPNVLATPHLGYVADSNYRTYYREAVENISAFLAGAPIRKLSPP